MPPNQINFESLHFNNFYNERFSDAEDQRDPDENFFNEVNTQNFECSYLFPNETESFLSEKNLSAFLQNKIIEKSVSEKKMSYVTGDFSMNCLKYHENAKTKHFYDNIFEKGAILWHSASLIDNTLTTDIFNNSLKKGITKSDVSDHFPIFLSIQLTKEKLREVL